MKHLPGSGKSHTTQLYQRPAPVMSMSGVGSACPVLEIDKILLLYDGRPSSLFAIRQYSTFWRADRLSCGSSDRKDHYMPNLHVPDNKLMREFIKRHFPKATFTVIKGDPKKRSCNTWKDTARGRTGGTGSPTAGSEGVTLVPKAVWPTN